MFSMLDKRSIPGLWALAEALSEALPEDDSRGDPQYLSRSALDIIGLAGNWTGDELLTSAVDCARRYWSGLASDEEREKMRESVKKRAFELRDRDPSCPETNRYLLVMQALDVVTRSDGYAADYLLDFALKAGIPLEVIRKALEANVPGLTALLAKGGSVL